MKGVQYDQVLAKGGFRIGSGVAIWQREIIHEKDCVLHWLRYDIRQICLSRSAKRIVAATAGFNITKVSFFDLTDELRYLYKQHRSFRGYPAEPTLDVFFAGQVEHGPFDTNCILLRDGEKLVGAGFYDKGATAAAAILNIWDPAYKRFSPGKRLLIEQICHSQSAGLTYLYPGYVIRESDLFDYKLSLLQSGMEVLDLLSITWDTYKGALPDFDTIIQESLDEIDKDLSKND